MGVVANEPSMEDILSSIKRIIADGSERAPVARASRKKAATDATDLGADAAADSAHPVLPEDEPAILELTEEISLDELVEAPSAAVPDDAQPDAAVSAGDEEPAVPAEPVSPVSDLQASAGMLSDRSAQAARESLSHLSTLLVRPREGESNTLEGLVREMLRPMLKEWLDANLPDLVESMVKKEIDRIVGRLG